MVGPTSTRLSPSTLPIGWPGRFDRANTPVRSWFAPSGPVSFTHENDTGPDGANHDRTGVFALSNLPGQPMGSVEGLSLVDVGPTILSLYGVDTPEGAAG